LVKISPSLVRIPSKTAVAVSQRRFAKETIEKIFDGVVGTQARLALRGGRDIDDHRHGPSSHGGEGRRTRGVQRAETCGFDARLEQNCERQQQGSAPDLNSTKRPSHLTEHRFSSPRRSSPAESKHSKF
jgi:hypothetical protein